MTERNKTSIEIVLQSLSKFMLLYNERLHLEKARGVTSESETYELRSSLKLANDRNAYLLEQAAERERKLAAAKLEIETLKLEKDKLFIDKDKLTETVVNLATGLHLKSKELDDEKNKNFKLTQLVMVTK